MYPVELDFFQIEQMQVEVYIILKVNFYINIF